MPKGKELTFKQRKFLKAYLESGNATQAALESYDCKPESAGSIGWELLKKLDLGEMMEEYGITDKLLIEKTKDGLEAKKRRRDFETGEIFYDEDQPTRHRYLTTALELKGRKGGEGQTNIQVNVQPLLGGETIKHVPSDDSNKEDS